MKRKISNNKGITLIALIITIIILLILAVVSIRIAIQNGLIKRATDAIGIHNAKEEEQNTAIEGYISDIDKLGSQRELSKPTEKEQNECQLLVNDSSKTKMVAGYGIKTLSEFESNALGVMLSESGSDVMLIDMANDKAYVYTTSEESAKRWNITTNKWYVSANVDSGKFEMYTGSSPVQISDFPESCIYSRSYLEKIIRSFGTEPDTNKLGKLTAITDEEMAQCKVDNETPWVAMKDNTDEQTTFGIIVVKEDDEFAVEIADGPNNKIYVYTTKEAIGNAKFNRWCVGNFDGSNPECEIYDGPSPIKASDFSSDQIYCSSYLNKIIASFNN